MTQEQAKALRSDWILSMPSLLEATLTLTPKVSKRKSSQSSLVACSLAASVSGRIKRQTM